MRWCADAADALLLLMHCCCWCTVAADALLLLMRCQASVSRRFSTVQLSSKGECIPDSRLCSLFFPIGGPTLASPTKAIGEIFREEIRLAPPSASRQEDHPRNTILSPVPPSREMSFLFLSDFRIVFSLLGSDSVVLSHLRHLLAFSLGGKPILVLPGFWEVVECPPLPKVLFNYPEVPWDPIHL